MVHTGNEMVLIVQMGWKEQVGTCHWEGAGMWSDGEMIGREGGRDGDDLGKVGKE